MWASTAQQSEGATHLCISLPLWASFPFRLPQSLNWSSLRHAVCLVYAIVVQLLGHVWLSVTSKTVARQALLSIAFPRQEYWVGCHFLLQGIFLTWGLNPTHIPCIGRQILSHWNTKIVPALHIPFTWGLWYHHLYDGYYLFHLQKGFVELHRTKSPSRQSTD